MAQYTFMSEKTGKRIAAALETMANMKDLKYDEEAGEYTVTGITSMLDAYKDGLSYGVSIPKGSATACTKIGANAGIANPTPGIVGRAASDPYAMVGPFVHFDVNARVDADGTPHVTAFEGDGRFRRDGSNGDVWVLAPVLWWLMDEEGEGSVSLSVCDSPAPGMTLQPQALLPDGNRRPYMLYAKYVGVKGDDGLMHSYAGRKPWNRNVSHTSLITQCANASTGYSGKSIADDWYLKTMFLLKYATKHSQSVFYGCASYDVQCAPTVAEEGVTRVIVSKANADKLLVGSAVMLGTHTGNNDRNTASNFDVFDGLRITKIEQYDDANSAVYIDSPTTFDVATTYWLSTSPWFSGTLDAVEGDGTLSDAGRLNGKEPFKLQGIETMMGLYAALGDVILSNTGEGWEACICYDSRNEATSLTDAYTHTGKHLPTSDADAWHYPMYPESAGGLLLGTTEGASQTTGLCDGEYTNKLATTGQREWLGLGYLNSAGYAGLFCVYGGGLGSASWNVGSRLSGTGRGRA